MPTVIDKKDRAGALSFALVLCDNLTRGGRAALPHERGMKSTHRVGEIRHTLTNEIRQEADEMFAPANEKG